MDRLNFRVYDKEDKKYVTVCFESEEDRYNVGQAMIHHSNDGGLWFSLSGYKDNETGGQYQLDCDIEQCVGRNDIKETPIYEGDIVKAWGGVGADGTLRREYYGQLIVFWNELESAFMLEDRANKDSLPFRRFEAFEVVGNIHAQ